MLKRAARICAYQFAIGALCREIECTSAAGAALVDSQQRALYCAEAPHPLYVEVRPGAFIYNIRANIYTNCHRTRCALLVFVLAESAQWSKEAAQRRLLRGKQGSNHCLNK
jgi:hypothetical protein